MPKGPPGLPSRDDAARDRVRQAFYQMVKFDIAALEEAYTAK